MAHNLLIVESPNKIKKIKSFLGDNWTVKASVGHIADLATKTGIHGLGIKDYENFDPIYSVYPDKKKVVQDLKNAVEKSTNVYLATDPDREGEAIANHLKSILKLKKYFRVTFNEISENAIKKALNEEHQIDSDLVNAQEARRIIDRLYGFLGSKIIQESSSGKMKSVGRVQSAGLKLLVDKEREIINFKPRKYKEPQIIINDLIFKIKLNKEEIIATKWEDISFDNQVTVEDIKKYDKKVNPSKPLTTNEALKVGATLGFNPKKTTQLLQTLFENGLITYIRTDSNNVSDEFKIEAKNFINDNFLIKSDITRIYKSKENAQEGHEAIRPVHLIEDGSDIANGEQKALYKAIYKISLASQMEVGIDTIQEISININNYEFVNASKVVKQMGFRDYFGFNNENYGDVVFEKGKYDCQVNLQDKTTTPPSRYSETSFLDKLEKSGIGRPSTFATILNTILERGYAKKQNKKGLVPSEIGMNLIEFLESNFTSLVRIDFTRDLENDLDLINQGTKNKLEIIKDFYKVLKSYIDKSKKTIEINLAKQNGVCPKCGAYLKILHFKSGSAKGCSNYPNCHHLEFMNKNKFSKSSTSSKSRFTKLMKKKVN